MQVVVRIRTAAETRVLPGRRANRRLASLAASLLLPLALFCFFVCGWRWSYDLGWTASFLARAGVLSHWQVWFVTGAGLQFLAVRLAGYAEPDRRAGAWARLLRKPHPGS